jgi:hypothetical protein
MLHKRYGDLGGYGIMSKDLRKRKDEKFVRFAKEYQKKREDSRETWEQQPSNVAYLTTSRIVKRIQLLLPADLKCNNNGEIISLANPCGTWKINSDIQDLALFECDPDRDLDQEELDKRQNELQKLWNDVSEEKKETIRLWKEENNKKNGGSPSVKATLENRYKALEKKSENVMDEIAQLKLRNSHTIFETFTDTEKELYERLLKDIRFHRVKPGHVDGKLIKKEGWSVVDEQKRREIFGLFIKAVTETKENQKKWNLTNMDLVKIRKNFFDPDYNKIIPVKEKLLDMETPDSWIEIIKNNSKTEEEFISSLKKLEKVLKRFGITQQTVDDINEGECIKEAIRRGIEKMGKE